MVLREYTQRHRLDAVAPADYHRHLPEQVARGLPSAELVVFRVADEHSDTAAFSARYGFGLEDCANTLVLRYKRDGAEGYAAVVNLGSRRLDVNGAVKALLGARRLSFAAREVATELTGMQFGGITAFGLPERMPLLVDAAVFERPLVVMGAGVRETKLLLSPSLLKDLPGVVVAELQRSRLNPARSIAAAALPIVVGEAFRRLCNHAPALIATNAGMPRGRRSRLFFLSVRGGHGAVRRTAPPDAFPTFIRGAVNDQDRLFPVAPGPRRCRGGHAEHRRQEDSHGLLAQLAGRRRRRLPAGLVRQHRAGRRAERVQRGRRGLHERARHPDLPAIQPVRRGVSPPGRRAQRPGPRGADFAGGADAHIELHAGQEQALAAEIVRSGGNLRFRRSGHRPRAERHRPGRQPAVLPAAPQAGARALRRAGQALHRQHGPGVSLSAQERQVRALSAGPGRRLRLHRAAVLTTWAATACGSRRRTAARAPGSRRTTTR